MNFDVLKNASMQRGVSGNNLKQRDHRENKSVDGDSIKAILGGIGIGFIWLWI